MHSGGFGEKTSVPYMDGGDDAVSWITSPHDEDMVETTELRKPPTTFGFPSLLQSASFFFFFMALTCI